MTQVREWPSATTLLNRQQWGEDYRTRVQTQSALLLPPGAQGWPSTFSPSPNIGVTQLAAPVDNSWEHIAWSPSLQIFAAVSSSGSGDRVMTSPDGTNWTIGASAADLNWNGLVWSDELGMFCAVASSGTGNRIMTSYDGLTWTSRITPTSPGEYTWFGIDYAPGFGFISGAAASSASAPLLVSQDGITWSYLNKTTFNDTAISDIKWNERLKLFTGGYGGSSTGGTSVPLFYYSQDAINWLGSFSTVSILSSNASRSPVYSPRANIYVLPRGKNISLAPRYSYDLNIWFSGNQGMRTNVLWVEEWDLFVSAFGGIGGSIVISKDGLNWITISAPNINFQSIAWSPQLGIAVAVASSGTNRICIIQPS